MGNIFRVDPTLQISKTTGDNNCSDLTELEREDAELSSRIHQLVKETQQYKEMQKKMEHELVATKELNQTCKAILADENVGTTFKIPLAGINKMLEEVKS